MYGMGFAFALIVAKKRKLLGDTGAAQSGLCHVLIWLAAILSIAGLVVRTLPHCVVVIYRLPRIESNLFKNSFFNRSLFSCV